MSLKKPLIIIGMHRSGTSLLAKVLEKAGIFMGVMKDHNYEAIHFLSLNQQTLWAAGGSWIDPVVPEPIYWKRLLNARQLYEEHFRLDTKPARFYHRLFPRPWGWKDPRNTFTLPMWLDLFPEARVLHITRDPQEVARSLQVRNHKKGEVFDERLNDLEFCLQLAEKYISQGRSYANQLGKNYCEVDYSALLSLDRQEIRRIEDFCGTVFFEELKSYLQDPIT